MNKIKPEIENLTEEFITPNAEIFIINKKKWK